MNDKLILEALSFLLVVNHPISDEARDKRLEIINKIDQVLNPKEDVPYEDSLEVCANCGKIEGHHAEYNLCNPLASEKEADYGKMFVKSSSEEKK